MVRYPPLHIHTLTHTKIDICIELALLNDGPRTATVVAHGPLKCATLGKKAFNRLLGPVLDILKRNSQNYHEVISSLPSASIPRNIPPFIK